MKRVRRLAVVGFALLLAACQGSFSSGTQVPQLPQTLSQQTPYGQTPTPNTPATPSKSTSAQAQSFPLTDAPNGLKCPTAAGYSCVLRLNMPPATPTPSPSPTSSGKGKQSLPIPAPTPSPTPTETPTPSPTPSPSPGASGSPGASAHSSASPTPTSSAATVSLDLTASPLDAPKMINTSEKNVTETSALLRLTLTFSADYTLDGPASIVFTLPKDQLLKDRGFAIQLFEETIHKKRHDFKPLFALAKSTIDKDTLTFSFTPPRLALPKDHHYLIVLYGDQLTATPAPTQATDAGTNPSALPSALPGAAAGTRAASPSPTPTGSPSASASPSR